MSLFNRAEVIDDNFISFLNEEKFPYLTKIYDSNNDNLKYKVKIFEINFEKFHKFTE